MSADLQTFVALLVVVAAVAILARRLTVWVRSGGQGGCGNCGSCSAAAPGPSRGLVELTDFAAPSVAGLPISAKGQGEPFAAEASATSPP